MYYSIKRSLVKGLGKRTYKKQKGRHGLKRAKTTYNAEKLIWRKGLKRADVTLIP